jgi:hypothetical protein
MWRNSPFPPTIKVEFPYPAGFTVIDQRREERAREFVAQTIGYSGKDEKTVGVDGSKYKQQNSRAQHKWMDHRNGHMVDVVPNMEHWAKGGER